MTTDLRTEEKPRIPESVFKEHVDALVDPNDNPDRHKWLNVCIDPRLSVDVVDDTTGEFLFRVPPLTYTRQVLDNIPMTQAMKTLAELRESNPYEADRYAKQILQPEIVHGEPPAEDIAAWRYIINRYKNGVKDGVKEKVAVSEAQIEINPDEW